MHGALMLLHVVILAKGGPAEANTRLELLVNRGKVLLSMRLLLKRLVTSRLRAVERACLAMNHRDVALQSIVKGELSTALTALVRSGLLVQSPDMLVPV